ncbi:MAG: hypothetical protein GC158_17370 [Cyanobacteria bacterium RI_101]|nr:hypothetical protein [Cyanobacteria bacterium RI_101]
MGIGPTLYCLWATLAIGLSIALAGLSAESVTRLLTLAFLGGQIALRSQLTRRFSWLPNQARFLVLGASLAAVVEGFHLISAPVFPSLRITGGTPLREGLLNYGIDLLFTLPAYIVIFSTLWLLINRYHFSLWQYVLIMALGQTLGDGGLLYFLKAPAMLFFLPYPMTNYHAINVIPFLAVRESLPPNRSFSVYKYLALPALVGVYGVCGAIIQFLGRILGLETA